ncbi:hypothetical protein Tco_0715768 [Tanacetum coccineum]
MMILRRLDTIFKHGFTNNYTWWKHHGEARLDCNDVVLESNVNNNDDNCGSSNQNINDMLHDAEPNAELDMENYNNCLSNQKNHYTTLMEFDEDVTKNGPAAKVLWYLPIIPRLKQLYSNPKNAKLLRWHAEDRKHDGKMRHVADASQWKNIDNHYTKFGDEIRNIRFGLSSDGINPFGNMSSHHSTGHGNLSGYGTKGEKACPVCEKDTHSRWLTNCKKTVYMGHRRSLPESHSYRKKKKQFDGRVEHRKMARLMNGHDTLSRVKDIKNVFGKKDKALKNNKNIWKKKSIFWKLPYWEHLQVRHSLDVMHIEKNVSESLIGLLLNIKGKTKDGINARKDMVEMGIRYELAPQEIVPSGYSANIKKLVSMKDLKLIGMKSHDCHVLITQMIPIAILGILPPRVRHTITKLCLFFNMIHLKVIDLKKLDEWQRDIILTLCQLEMYFPPSFLDVMVHLVSHIIEEIKALGSNVEGYVLEEVVSFCTSYIDGIPDIGVPESRHEGRLEGKGTIGRNDVTPNYDDLEQAHFTVLQNMTSIAPYIHEHIGYEMDCSSIAHEYSLSVETVVDEDEYNQFDELPPFSIGIQSVDEVLDDTIYLRSDHQEGYEAED